MEGQFGWDQWAVVAGFFALTTLVGALSAGKQATIRDFFLGGRKLPWYAVSASMISTEISAATLISVPAFVYAPGGNLTYLQLGLFGSILARVIVGFVFVPAFYEREIYSPYDYVAQRLGERVRPVISGLFMLGGILGQGARLYLTALVLDLILGPSALATLAHATGTTTLTWSIWLTGLFSILWTFLGGMRTVIWTDVILFFTFVGSSVAALVFIVSELPGGWTELWEVGTLAEKLRFFNFDSSPAAEFTLWTATIAATWMGVALYGTDQLLAQRMFCCKGPRQARWAIIVSSVGQLVTITVAFVGVALFAFYQRFPADAHSAELITEKADRVFPIFILTEMTRLTIPIAGLAVAGIFAAAMSSILAALSETTMSAFYYPLRQRWGRKRFGLTDANPALPQSDPDNVGGVAAADRRQVLVARIFVVFWGVVLCLMAQVAVAATKQFPLILNLAQSMVGYTGGALLAGFMMSFLRLNVDGRGYLISAPLSVLTVFAVVWHDPWTQIVCIVGIVLIFLAWGLLIRNQRMNVNVLLKSMALMAGLAMVWWLNTYGYLEAVPKDHGTFTYTTIAWPWFIPIGSVVAFLFGWLLSEPQHR